MMKRRNTTAIINNDFNQKEIDIRPIKFIPANGYEYIREFMNDELSHEYMNTIFMGSEFEVYAKMDANGNFPKLNKKEMNGVYVHACKQIGNRFKKLEILIALHEYFDLDIEKFYKSISNIFKSQIMDELESKTKKRKSYKLF